MKEFPENPFLIGALFALLTGLIAKIIIPVFTFLFREKHKDLESKIDHKDLKLQEHSMKEWVKKILDDTLKDFKASLKDFKESLKKEMREIEERIEKRNSEKFQKYKDYHHGRIAEMQTTVNHALEALKRAESLDNSINKINQIISDLLILKEKKQ